MTNIEFAEALRKIAEFYEANPTMIQPHEISIWTMDGKRFLELVRMAGSITKIPPTKDDEFYFTVQKDFAGYPLTIRTMRSDICRKVKKTVEIEAWECPESLLGKLEEIEAAAAQKAAAAREELGEE